MRRLELQAPLAHAAQGRRVTCSTSGIRGSCRGGEVSYQGQEGSEHFQMQLSYAPNAAA
jgi:hypothetical protein